MPRKKLIRRFEPRFGVSREMLDVESKYVRREQEDYLLLSTNELRERVASIGQRWREADADLERRVYALSERERLAPQCMLVRDLYHLLELYRASIGAGDTPEAAPRRTTPAIAPTEGPASQSSPAEPPSGEPQRLLPFSEWLFETA